MKYCLEDLQRFWKAAGKPLPLVIVGGGRWGRVWTGVAASAREGSNDITLVSREHRNEVRSWLSDKPILQHVQIAGNIIDAMQSLANPTVVIIASRPKDHVRDAHDALEMGGHVLIEKPISDDTGEARQVLDYANSKQQVVGVATEFAFLPPLHYIANKLQQSTETIRRIEVRWADPNGEMRHDGIKRQHSEISVIEDILPHFVSLIQILLPDVNLELNTANESRTCGNLDLVDNAGRSFNLWCDKAANTRERSIKIITEKAKVHLNFTSSDPIVMWNDDIERLPDQWLCLDSTLRLELGAFNLSIENDAFQSALTSSMELLLKLHDKLQAARSAKV